MLTAKLIVISFLLMASAFNEANCVMDFISDMLYPKLSNTTGNVARPNNRTFNSSMNVNLQHDGANSTAAFINQTLSHMPKGVCYKEVPTASLVESGSHVPRGNGSNSGLSRVQVCCDGFVRNPHNFRKCDPVCLDGCINGICVAPEICECFPNHVVNLAGICLPTCPISCGNGECTPDGKCACKAGYKLEPRFGKFCIPECSGGCPNGNCTEPNRCECNRGYELNFDGKCAPVCKNGCASGECIAPDVCSCRPGFLLKDKGCEATCTKGCINGRCTAPDVCTCEPGWEIDITGTRCIPHCARTCMNGNCVAANTCGCNRGYTLSDLDAFMCVPHCSNGCPNGVCTAPNMCLCKAGFVKDRSVRGSQSCVPA